MVVGNLLTILRLTRSFNTERDLQNNQLITLPQGIFQQGLNLQTL